MANHLGAINIFKPRRLKKVIGDHVTRFSNRDQQDAQEFMISLLDMIDKELSPSADDGASSSDTIIRQLFFGKMKTKITCLECNQNEKTENIIGFLPVPLCRQERIFEVSFVPHDGFTVLAGPTYVPVVNSGRIEHVVRGFAE